MNIFFFFFLIIAADVISNKSTPNSTTITTPTLSRYALWIEPRDVWCVKLDPIWIDFLGARSVGQNKSVPFVDAVPITFWIHGGSSAKLNLSPSMPSFSLHNLNPTEEERSLYERNHSHGDNRQDLNAINYNATNPFYSPINDEISIDGDSTTINAKLSKPDNNELSLASSNDDSADLHVIAHVSNLVSLQIDHYQYLFLLRLAEEMTELSTFLTIDSKRILKDHAEDKSIVIGCVVPQVEVTFVMPSQTPGKESSAGDGESVLPDSASLGDDLLMNSSGVNVTNWPGGLPLSLDQMKNHQNANTFGSIETPSPVTNDAPQDVLYQQYDQQQVQYTSNPNTHGFNVQIVSTSEKMAATLPQSSTPVQNARGKNRNSTTDSGLKDIGSSLISMKKGFSNFMTSIDTALKNNPSDDISDTISIQSDISSDSENFIMVLADDKTADCMDVMFRLVKNYCFFF